MNRNLATHTLMMTELWAEHKMKNKNQTKLIWLTDHVENKLEMKRHLHRYTGRCKLCWRTEFTHLQPTLLLQQRQELRHLEVCLSLQVNITFQLTQHVLTWNYRYLFETHDCLTQLFTLFMFTFISISLSGSWQSCDTVGDRHVTTVLRTSLDVSLTFSELLSGNFYLHCHMTTKNGTVQCWCEHASVLNVSLRNRIQKVIAFPN